MIRADRVKGNLTFDYLRPPNRRVSVKSQLLEANSETIVMAHAYSPSKPVIYSGEIVLDVGYWGIWFLFKNRSFDTGRVYRPDRTWMGYYVDVLEPVQWRGSDPSTLEPITDLFLDLWIAPDGNYMVLDEDELEDAVNRFTHYPRGRRQIRSGSHPQLLCLHENAHLWLARSPLSGTTVVSISEPVSWRRVQALA